MGANAKAGFHGHNVVMRQGAAQATVLTTAIAAAAGANPTKAEYDALVTRFNLLLLHVAETDAVLVEKGVMKGAA